MNPHVRLLVGRPVCHNFLKRQGSYTSNPPIGALANMSTLMFCFFDFQSLCIFYPTLLDCFLFVDRLQTFLFFANSKARMLLLKTKLLCYFPVVLKMKLQPCYSNDRTLGILSKWLSINNKQRDSIAGQNKK